MCCHDDVSNALVSLKKCTIISCAAHRRNAIFFYGWADEKIKTVVFFLEP